ncbi:MAG: JmjC domain-containing protein [Pseudonocardiaceae bacterium]
MEHRLVQAVGKALDWSGPGSMGTAFARGSLDDPGLCARLLTPGRLLDVIMRRSLEPPQLRIFRDGHELHPDNFLTTGVERRGKAVRMTDMRKLASQLKTGCTVVLDTLDLLDPTMEIACRALQWWSGERVQVNIYLTTHNTAGFDLHWDDHDVLVVQLAGSKTWEVRGTSRPAPLRRDAAQNTEPGTEVLWSGSLHTGQVMHIPRGFWHRATRADRGAGFSLHATFGIAQRTGVDWLNWIADRAREHELFRRDLPRAGEPAARERHHRELAATAAQEMAERSAERFVTEQRREHPPARHVVTRELFGPPREVVCVTAFEPEIRISADRVEVLAGGRRLTAPAAATDALRMLLSGHPVIIDDVTAETRVDARALARRLIEEELCAEATPELCSGYTGLLTAEMCSPTP